MRTDGVRVKRVRMLVDQIATTRLRVRQYPVVEMNPDPESGNTRVWHVSFVDIRVGHISFWWSI